MLFHTTTSQSASDTNLESSQDFLHNQNVKRSLRSIMPSIKVSAILEVLLFLIVATALDAYAGSGNRFADSPLHPFWIIILIVSVQYGLNEALFAALLSSAFLLIGNWPEQRITENIYDHQLRIVYLPTLWMFTAFILGSMRTRQARKAAETEEKLQQAEYNAQTIAEGYNSLKKAKEQLELRLASEQSNIIELLHVLRSYDHIPLDNVSEMACRLIQVTLNPKKFSIYHAENDGLCLNTSYGWEKEDRYQRILPPSSPLTQGIMRQKRIYTIVNAGDESVLASQGLLAAPLVDIRTGQCFGMIKIEDISVVDLNSRTHQVFKILCEWVANMYAHASRMQLEIISKGKNHSSNTAYKDKLKKLMAAYV